MLRVLSGLFTAFMIVLMVPVGSAAAAEPEPVVQLPTGQGLSFGLNPLAFEFSGFANGLTSGLRDFDLNLLLIQCNSKVGTAGTFGCGLPSTAPASPVEPAPAVPAPTPTDDRSVQPPADAQAESTPSSGRSAPPASEAGLADVPDEVTAADETGDAVDDGGDDGRDDPSTDLVAAPSIADDQRPAPSDEQASGHTGGAVTSEPWEPTENVGDVISFGVAGFTMLALVGVGGLGASGLRSQRMRFPKTADKVEGIVLEVESGIHEFDGENAGPGDRSRVWRLVGGWLLVDRVSRLMPYRLASRAPLMARVLVDGAYLRACFGVAWAVLPIAAAVVGLMSAHASGGFPLPATFTLTAVLLVIAVLDATSGLVGVFFFGLGVLIWGPGDLTFWGGVRSFLGMAGLWFAVPLIASAARPLRRAVLRRREYIADRVGDGIIAALIGGWAVLEVVAGLSGLCGRVVPLADRAGSFALITVGTIAVRVVVEEVAALGFPERLKAVELQLDADPTVLHQLLGVVLRTGVFALVAYAFIGPCWELIVSILVVLTPQLIAVFPGQFASVPGLATWLPRGVLLVLAMIVVEYYFGRFAEAWVDDPQEVLRLAFLLMLLPGFVLALFELAGGEAPEGRWTWAKQAGGVVVVAAATALVLNGW